VKRNSVTPYYFFVVVDLYNIRLCSCQTL